MFVFAIRFCLSLLRVGWVSVRQELNTTNHTHTCPEEYARFDIIAYTEKGLFLCTIHSTWSVDNVCDNFEFNEAQNDWMKLVPKPKLVFMILEVRGTVFDLKSRGKSGFSDFFWILNLSGFSRIFGFSSVFLGFSDSPYF